LYNGVIIDIYLYSMLSYTKVFLSLYGTAIF